MKKKPSEYRSKPDMSIDFSQWVWKILSFWWLFLITISLSLVGAHLYLRYATPKYMAQAKLLIKGVGSSSNFSEISILSEGLGIETGAKDMTNEIEILKSRPIFERVVQELGIGVSYFRQGVFRNTELYLESPFFLESYSLNQDMQGLSFYIEVGYENTFLFKKNEDDEGGVEHKFNQTFRNNFGEFHLVKNPNAKLYAGLYKINITPVEGVANYYKRALQVEVVGARGSSVLNLKLIDPNISKAADILNTLIKVYNEAEIADNTQVLKNTSNFVEDRVSELSIELDSIETDIEKFKSKNEIITDGASESLNFRLSELRSTIEKLSGLETEKDLLTSLEQYIQADQHQLIPTNLIEVAPTLAELIGQYNNIYLQRSRIAETISDSNPQIKLYNNELDNLKNLVLRSIQNLRSNLNIPISKAEEELTELKVGLSNIPVIEKQLLEKLRMQSIKENLFLFLLQKKEETELSRAVTTANTRIIESARNYGGTVSPNKKLIRTASLLAGLLIPMFFLVIREVLKTTVDSEETIKNLTSAPIIGRIAKYDPKLDQLLTAGERSIRAEMFRLVRTNLSYSQSADKKQIILLTSATSGEGKSVTAINLAITVASAGKKVIVVDFDLRKPKIGTYLGSSSCNGLTHYLVGSASMNDIIQIDEEKCGLHFIPSGAIPPNPAELLLTEKLDQLMNQLKEDYDIIILDCPPIGVVADALLLRNYLTHMLYIVRDHKTTKESLKYFEEQYQKDELVNPMILINDFKADGKAKYYSGYHANYGGKYYIKK